MYILPAIDLLDGRVVRLAQGDYNRTTQYGDDPVAQARDFESQGATWLHVVDLNAARSGEISNFAVVQDIIRSTDLHVEVGGGIRSMQAVQRYADAGAARVVIGTKLITDPEFAKAAAAAFGELICAGVDAKDSMVAISGWNEASSRRDIDVISELGSWGIRHLVYTDIARDGMQTGIDAEKYTAVAKAAGFAVIASGGISSLDDLCALRRLGSDTIEGIITGRALYEGSFSVKEAVEVLR